MTSEQANWGALKSELQLSFWNAGVQGVDKDNKAECALEVGCLEYLFREWGLLVINPPIFVPLGLSAVLKVTVNKSLARDELRMTWTMPPEGEIVQGTH